jgi:hypothetical protein
LQKNPISNIEAKKNKIKNLTNNTRKQVVTKLTENDVVSVWQKYTVGEIFYWGNDTIRIMYPGRMNNNGGCDLNDAVFLLNGKTVTGNVEVHIRGSDWYRHGHRDDPRYNDIAIHVVAIDDTDSITRTSHGRNIPLINIGDLVEYIYSGGINTYKQERYFKCQAISHTFNNNSMVEYLYTIGMRRFKNRAGNFYRILEKRTPEQVIYPSISRCLGYEKNTAPFEKLADNLSSEKLKNLEYKAKPELMAFIIGSAGLLPVQMKRNSAIFNMFTINQVSEMENYWLKGEFRQILCAEDWCFFRIRPANHPIRRLIALCEILYRNKDESLVEKMASLILNTCCQKVSNMERELLISWESIYTDSSGVKARLLGRNKVRQIIINTVLPFMFAYGLHTGDRELSYKSKGLYSNFPGLEGNHLISYMKAVLKMNTKLKLTAVEQQGLIHLFNNFCRNKDCSRCLNTMKVMSALEQHQDRNFRLSSSVS